MSMSDPEKHVRSSEYGFPALAAFVARDPDHETYIFRKYNKLTARNLIHLQSELLHLENQLTELDDHTESGASSAEYALCMRNSETLRKLAAERDGDERRLVQLLDKIEVKLDKYQKALLQASSIARLKAPSKRVVKAYQNVFSGMDVRGHSAAMLEDEDDLVALKPPADADLLSRVVRDHWPLRTESLESSQHGQAEYFHERHLQLIVSTVSVGIAAVLLVGSIVTLYCVHNPDARLGLLILFILLFAIGIRISTSASRDGIFTATAAYAAVLVVFVSGDLGKAKAGQG